MCVRGDCCSFVGLLLCVEHTGLCEVFTLGPKTSKQALLFIDLNVEVASQMRDTDMMMKSGSAS